MDEKKLQGNFSWRQGYRRKDEMQVASKKVYWKKEQECSKNLWHIATEKDIFSELNWCIFPISLKYIKVSYSKNTLHAGIMQF